MTATDVNPLTTAAIRQRFFLQSEEIMGDKGKRDKGKREKQKKAKLTQKEKRRQKRSMQDSLRESGRWLSKGKSL